MSIGTSNKLEQFFESFVFGQRAFVLLIVSISFVFSPATVLARERGVLKPPPQKVKVPMRAFPPRGPAQYITAPPVAKEPEKADQVVEKTPKKKLSGNRFKQKNSCVG